MYLFVFQIFACYDIMLCSISVSLLMSDTLLSQREMLMPIRQTLRSRDKTVSQVIVYTTVQLRKKKDDAFRSYTDLTDTDHLFHFVLILIVYYDVGMFA